MNLFGLFNKPKAAPNVVTRKIKMAYNTPNYAVADDYSTAKMELQAGGARSIARAQDLLLNSPLPKAYYNCLCRYVVGDSGFMLRAKVARTDGTLDTELNKVIETAWKDFILAENISVSRNRSAQDLNMSLVYSLVVSGDAFIRINESPRWKHGMALQVISPERIESPALFSSNVFNGIRLDSFDTPLSYFVRVGEQPGGYQTSYAEVPASQMIHTWLPGRPDANRGITPLAPVAKNIYDIDAVRESTRANLRHFANLLAVFVPNTEDNPYEPDASGADHEASMVSFAKRMASHFKTNPGTFGVAPSGGDIKQLDPKHPVSNYADFIKTENNQICPALGLTSTLLLANLENTSYSSSKAASQYDADFMRLWQAIFINHIWTPIYRRWMKIQLANGAFGIYVTEEDEIAALSEHKFVPRAFPMADTFKDAKGASQRLADRTITRSAILAAEGLDFEEDIAKVTAHEDEILTSYGLILLHTPDPAPNAPETEEEEVKNESTAK